MSKTCNKGCHVERGDFENEGRCIHTSIRLNNYDFARKLCFNVKNYV
jgi:hypothetical protein